MFITRLVQIWLRLVMRPNRPGVNAHNAAKNLRRRTDLELVEELLAAARPLIRIPVGTARLADAARMLEFVVLLGRIGAGMLVARREIKNHLREYRRNTHVRKSRMT